MKWCFVQMKKKPKKHQPTNHFLGLTNIHIKSQSINKPKSLALSVGMYGWVHFVFFLSTYKIFVNKNKIETIQYKQ